MRTIATVRFRHATGGDGEEQRETILRGRRRGNRAEFGAVACQTTDERFHAFRSKIPSPTHSTVSRTRQQVVLTLQLLPVLFYEMLIEFLFDRLDRAISVMLGDAWKRLNPAEKEIYTAEAHLRAEEYRRLFPDCWKRKRSKSTS